MRAQDANRRRHTSTDISRDALIARPVSLGSPKLAPPVPPPPPPRSMMQSASVCDLSSPQMWNPGMHQVICIYTTNFERTSNRGRLFYSSDSIDGSSGPGRRACNVVPTESSMGHDHGWFDDEFEPSGNVGISHGISSVADASTALSRLSVEGAQSREKLKIKQKIQGCLALAQYKIQEIVSLAIAIQTIARITVRRELRGFRRIGFRRQAFAQLQEQTRKRVQERQTEELSRGRGSQEFVTQESSRVSENSGE